MFFRPRRRPSSTLVFFGSVLLACGAVFARSQDVPADHAERMARGLSLFRSDVAEILRGQCVDCHGGQKTRSDFDLATREGLLRGGAKGKAITPFSAADSPLVKMVRRQLEPFMPDKHEPLPEASVTRLAEWIDAGAPYDGPLIAGKAPPRDKSKVSDQDRQWWAFQPLKPQPHRAVDEFLLAKAKDTGLDFSPEADRRTLIRRASLDLTGLPPTPEEVEAFLSDSSPHAWEKVVDRLLASPHFGERWARHWLDVARFAESSGFEHDYDRPYAYHFRDFVIRALNDDMPFDRFARWQLAGDEFAPGDAQAMTATGFLGAGVFPTQITANEVERTRYDALDDMLSTTGSAFLALTVGCARCHDNKFDPIPMKDYYGMLSAFTTTVRSNIDLEIDPQKVAADKATHAAKTKELEADIAACENGLRPKFDAWLSSDHPALPVSGWQLATFATIHSANGAAFTDLKDGSWLAGGPNPANDHYTVTVSCPPGNITALKLEALSHGSLPLRGPGRAGNGNFALSTITVRKGAEPGGPGAEIRLASAEATHQQNTGGLSVASSLDNAPNTGWAVDGGGIGKDQAALFRFAEPVSMPAGGQLTVEMDFRVNTAHCIGRPRLSVWTGDAPQLKAPTVSAGVVAAARKLSAKAPLSDAEKADLFDWWRQRDEGWKAKQLALTTHLSAQTIGKTPVMVCAEGFPPLVMHSQGAPFLEKTHFLRRGDTNMKQEEARLTVLQVLNRSGDLSRWQWNPPPGAKYSGRRRTLANWMTDVEHGAGALLARVAVNRLWQHHFGRGIVATPNDFGKTGAFPDHPELLDWLAEELIRNGWRQKPVHRLMLLSAAYRQSTAVNPKNRTADPDNTLFLQRLPARLEGEAVRDSALAACGLLDRTLFGKGTLDEASVRRSIYFTIKRSEMVNSMLVFDAPEPLSSTGARPTTTVAPQALLLMNGPNVRRWAAAFAARLDKDIGSASADDFAPQIRRAYALALGREPRGEELDASQKFIRQGLAEGRTAALTDFCQTLLSLNEFAYQN